jgi:hypothetical protein
VPNTAITRTANCKPVRIMCPMLSKSGVTIGKEADA